MRHFKGLLAAFTLLSLLISSSAFSEQKVVQDGYEVHYSAVTTDFLTPEVAQAYGIVRSRVMALLNIAILKINPDGSTTPVNALVSGEAVNLLQQGEPLSFKRITEANAIYYISNFRFTNEEQLRFDLQVQPDPDKPAITVRFSQTFYTN